MGEKLTDYSYSLKKERERKITNIILFVVIVFVVINLLLSFFIFPVRQISNSMNPDFPENSLVMVSPVVKNIQRGDVVLIKSNVKNDKQTKFNNFVNLFVKFFTAQQIDTSADSDIPGSKEKLRRIVALPGDTIYMRDYVLYVKPANEKHFLTEFEITEKLYNVTFFVAPGGWDSSIGVKGSFDEITLKNNEYFVLGDNRKACDDSRLWGPVTLEDIVAKTLFCYFPIKNMKLY